MAKLGSDVLVSPQDLLSSLPTIQTELGNRVTDSAGRVYRYAQAGASNLVQGNMLQSPISVANHQHIAVAATAATGSYTVTATLGATAATSGFYSNGYMSVDTGSGLLGATYSIVGNGAVLSGGVITLTLGEPLQQALTTSAYVSLTPNTYSGVIQMPATTPTGIPVGVALTNMTAAYYGWIQTRGVASVLSDASTATQGKAVQIPSGTAGAVTANAATATSYVVGVAQIAGTSAQCNPVFLTLE